MATEAEVEHDTRDREVVTLRAILISALLVIFAVILASILFITLYLQPILSGLDNSARRQTCSLEVNAEVWQAIADSLDITPGPDRDDSIREIKKTAKKFDACR